MEWLHIVVITLIYIHEPKTVTWAKECEIPDYAYSEKRRKNQHGDELVCLDQDVERHNENSLYDSKLVSINTRKKYEGLKNDDLYSRDERDSKFLEKNNYISRALQPPSNRSTYQMLLYRYQPYAYSHFAMDTPKNIFNIYQTKSPEYEKDLPQQLKMLHLEGQNKAIDNQVFHIADRAGEHWSVKQPYVNKQNLRSPSQYNNKTFRNEDFKIRHNSHQNPYPISIQKQMEPTFDKNENTIKPDNVELKLPNSRKDLLKENALIHVELPQSRNLKNISKVFSNNKIINSEDVKETENKMVTSNGNTYSSYMVENKQNLNMQTNQMLQRNNQHTNTIKNSSPNQINEKATALQKKPNSNQLKAQMKQNIKTKHPNKVFPKKDYALLSTHTKGLNPSKYSNVQDENADNKLPELNQDVNENKPQDQESSPSTLYQEETNSVNENNEGANQPFNKEVVGMETPTLLDETKTHLTPAESQSNKVSNILINSTNTTNNTETNTKNQKNKNFSWPYSILSSHISAFNNRPEEYSKVESDSQLTSQNRNEDLANQSGLGLINTDQLNEISKTGTDNFTICNGTNELLHEKLQSGSMDEITNRHLNNIGITIYNTENSNVADCNPKNKLRSNACAIKDNDIDETVKSLQQADICNSEKQVDTIKYNREENVELNTGQHFQQFSDEQNKIKLKRREQENERYKETNAGNFQTENSKSDRVKESEEDNCQWDVNRKRNSEEKPQANNATVNDSSQSQPYNYRIGEPDTKEDIEELKTNETDTKLKTEFNNTHFKVNTVKPSTFKKMYNKINFFKSKDKKLNLQEGANSTAANSAGKNNSQITGVKASDKLIRIGRMSKSQMERQNNQELLHKWMELHQDFMSHIDKHNIPKFPVIKTVKCERKEGSKFPVQLEIGNESSNEFPLTLKVSEENRCVKGTVENNNGTDEVKDFGSTDEPEEVTTVGYINEDKRKRDIHCCFKLSDGQHLGEQDNNRDQLKQIDLKIENKKMKGCPLKETSIEMILTKDRLSREDDAARYSNQTSQRVLLLKDEMQPFQINNTNNRQQVSKFQSMKEFNKLYSLSKVNRNQDMWEKQIKKLYEIINDEKKGDRNKTTFSSLHKTTEPEEKVQKSKKTGSKALLITQTRKKEQEEPQLSSVMQMYNHIPERVPGREKYFKVQEQIQQNSNDKRLLSIHGINKINTDVPSKNNKIRYHNSINKFRDNLIKDENEESLYYKKKGLNNKGTKNGKIKGTYQEGLEDKTVKGNNIKLYNKEMKSSTNSENRLHTITPNAKLLKKCENLKNNISHILNLMSELQDEGKSNPESMDSFLQFTGFDNLLNNLRKFNRNPNFSLINGKNVSATYQQEESIDLKSQDNKLGNGKNSRGTSDNGFVVTDVDNSGTDVDHLESKGSNRDMSRENVIGNNSKEPIENGFATDVNTVQTFNSMNENVPDDIQIKTTNIQYETPELQTTDVKRIDTADTTKEKTYGLENSKMDINMPMLNECDEMNMKKTYPIKVQSKEKVNTSNFGKNLTCPTNDNVTHTSPEKLNDVTEERNMKFPKESILDSISGKSIIKLVQNETLDFDKFNSTNNASTQKTKLRKPDTSYILRVTNVPTNLSQLLANIPVNFSQFCKEKESRKVGKLKSRGPGGESNMSIPFDLQQLSQIVGKMQDIPNKVTMPVIIDILNSLMSNQDIYHLPKRKGSNDKRLKRENFKQYNLQVPSNNEVEINMNVKKGRKKKIRKNKNSLNKFARGKIKTVNKEKSSRTVTKIESCQKAKLKPIYMPNVKRGRSKVQLVPPFFFGDNIITISVTPSDSYNKSKKNKNKISSFAKKNSTNMTDVRANSTAMVTETKYFVMSNIKGEVTEKARPHQETQLRLPTKFFKSKEKTTTATNALSTRKLLQNFVTTPSERSDTLNPNKETLLLQAKTEIGYLREPPVTLKKFMTITNQPILKLRSEEELEDLKLKLEKIKMLHKLNLFNTSNDKMFDSILKDSADQEFDLTESYDKSLTATEKTNIVTTTNKKEIREPTDFTITITLKPQKVQGTQRSTTSRTTVKQENIKQDKFQTSESHAPEAVTEITASKQYSMSLAPETTHLHISDDVNVRKQIKPIQIEIDTDRNEIIVRTTQPTTERTSPTDEYKDLSANGYDFKESNYDMSRTLTNTETATYNYQQKTSEASPVTESNEDFTYTDHINLQTNETPQTARNLSMYKQQEESQNQEMLPKVAVTLPEFLETNMYDEDSTDVQYYDELESVMENYEEKPKLVSLYQPVKTTEPLNAIVYQTEPWDLNRDSDYIVPSQQMNPINLNTMTQTRPPNPEEGAPTGKEYWFKEELSGRQFNMRPENITFITTTISHSFKHGNKDETSGNKNSDEDDEEDGDMENDEKEDKVTTVRFGEFHQSSPAVETTEEEPEEDEEDDDEDSTDLQELLFWQTITKKPVIQIKQPYMFPMEMPSMQSHFHRPQLNNSNSSVEFDIKSMKFELEQLKNLLDSNPLADKASSLTNPLGTQSYSIPTQDIERVTDQYSLTEYPVNNSESQVIELPEVIEIKHLSGDNIVDFTEDNSFLESIDNKTEADIPQAETYDFINGVSESNPTYLEGLNISYLDTQSDDVITENLTGLEMDVIDIDSSTDVSEDGERSSEDQGLIHMDGPSIIIEDSPADTYSESNKDNSQGPAQDASDNNTDEVKPLDDANQDSLNFLGDELMNQIEVPPNNNSSAFELSDAMNSDNDTMQTDSIEQSQTNNWPSKTATKELDAMQMNFDEKETTDPNILGEQSSEMIILENMSNNSAEWVLHDDAMWNMDPWESFKQFDNNYKGPIKQSYEKDKLLEDLTAFEPETGERKLRGRDKQMINYSVKKYHNSNTVKHNDNLLNKSYREPIQQRGHNQLDHQRKYMKPTNYFPKYHKDMGDDGAVVLFQPKLSLLGRYNEENDTNMLRHSAFRKNVLDKEEPKMNIRAIKGKMNFKQFNTPVKLVSKKRSSKKSKIYGKSTSNKHRINSPKKKVRSKEKTMVTPYPLEFSENNTSTKQSAELTTPMKFLMSTYTSNKETQIYNISATIKHTTPANCNSTNIEINEITTLVPINNTQTTSAKQPSCNLATNKSVKIVGNLENLMWNKENHWERLNDSLSKADKLYDRNLMRKLNQNFRKNLFDARFLDRERNVINSSRKSNQKNFNFYKQRLNRKMTLLKSLQNKDKEAKITPEEERKIKKILDGIVSRYKGHINDTDDDDDSTSGFKCNRLNAGSKKNLTKHKNHRKMPKGSMKFDRYKFKCRSKERHSAGNLTDRVVSHRFVPVGKKNHFPVLVPYSRLIKKYRHGNSDFIGWGPMLKAGWYAKNENRLLHRDKKNDILEIPYIRIMPNISDNLMSIINANELPKQCKAVNFNGGVLPLDGNVDKERPETTIYKKNRGKLTYKVRDGLEQRATNTSKKQRGSPIQGILSLLYPEDLTNSSEPINMYYGLDPPASQGQMGGGLYLESPVEGVAGYSGGGATFNNHQINNIQFEEFLKSIEKDNINITENNENKFKDLNTNFKQNQKDMMRNRSREIDDVRAKIKAFNWLMNNKNVQNLNKATSHKTDVSLSKQDFNNLVHSQSKDKEEEIENMKKFINKYKSLLKVFDEQQHGKHNFYVDIKDPLNQNIMKSYKDELLPRDRNIIRRPTAMTNAWKKVKNKDKGPMRREDISKNIMLDNSSKKSGNKMFMYGQQMKQRKESENPVDDIQDSNEEQDAIRHLQEDDDDSLETCNDVEIETYDEHQTYKTKYDDNGLSNGTQSFNGSVPRTGPSRYQSPNLMLSKYKNLEKYKNFHNGQIPRLKLFKDNEGGFKLNTTVNKMFKNQINPISCIGEVNYDKCKANWENWTSDRSFSNKIQPQLMTDEPLANLTDDHNIQPLEEKEMIPHGSNVIDSNVLMLPIKFNTSDFIKLLNLKEGNDSDLLYQEEDLNNPNLKLKLWDPSNRNGYVFDVDKGGPNGIKNRYYITFDSLSPNTVKVKNVSTIPVSNFSEFVNMANSGLGMVGIHKFMTPWDKNSNISYINKNVRGNMKPEIRSVEKVCLWLRKPLSYNLTHQVPKVAISLGEVWPPISESQGPRNMKHYLVQVDPLVTPSKYPNQHIDYPSQISKVVWKAILHGFKTPKKTWQLTNQLG